MRIDAHQHFWTLSRGDYAWLTKDLAPIYRDFTPEDLTPILESHGIDGTILVQAAPTLAETQFMLSLAQDNAFIKGVVGWVDFASPTAAAAIAELAKTPKLVGLRPMIQDIDDPDWMLRPELAEAFDALIAADLTFDALTLPRHLKPLKDLIRRYPEMRMVIDHGSKPEIHAGRFDDWAHDIAEIADMSSAMIKLSGLVTEAGADCSANALKPYCDHLLKTFGAERIIWGSDWPVCTLACAYSDWYATTRALLADLSPLQRDGIMGLNALRAYHIKRET